MTNLAAIAAIQEDWEQNPRWRAVRRDYEAEDVYRLRGSVIIEHTLAHRGAEKLWRLLTNRPYVSTLGALTGTALAGSTEEAQFQGREKAAA